MCWYHRIQSYDAIRYEPTRKDYGCGWTWRSGSHGSEVWERVGLRVTVLSTSHSKKEEALTTLGADEFLVSKDEAAMKSAACTLDFIMDTAAGEHPLDPYLILLKRKGVLVFVGVPPEMKFAPHLLFTRKSISGSMIGGMKETQEMLEFCGERNVVPMIETVPIDKVNEAMKRLKANECTTASSWTWSHCKSRWNITSLIYGSTEHYCNCEV